MANSCLDDSVERVSARAGTTPLSPARAPEGRRQSPPPGIATGPERPLAENSPRKGDRRGHDCESNRSSEQVRAPGNDKSAPNKESPVRSRRSRTPRWTARQKLGTESL